MLHLELLDFLLRVLPQLLLSQSPPQYFIQTGLPIFSLLLAVPLFALLFPGLVHSQFNLFSGLILLSKGPQVLLRVECREPVPEACIRPRWAIRARCFIDLLHRFKVFLGDLLPIERCHEYVEEAFIRYMR